MAEWLRWVLGITIPLLIGHWVWITVTVIRMRQTMYGETGNNGLRADVKAVRTRTHDLANTLQGVSGNLEMLEKQVEHIKEDRQLERRKLPKRGHA